MFRWIEFQYPLYLNANDVNGSIMQRIDIECTKKLDIIHPFGLVLHPSEAKALHSCSVSVTGVFTHSDAIFPLLYKQYDLAQVDTVTKEYPITDSVGVYAINDEHVNGLPYKQLNHRLIELEKNIHISPLRLTFQRIIKASSAPISGFVFAKENRWSILPFSVSQLDTFTWFSKLDELVECIQSSDFLNELWDDVGVKLGFHVHVYTFPVLKEIAKPEPKLLYTEKYIHPKYGILEIIPTYASPKTKSKRVFSPETNT